MYKPILVLRATGMERARERRGAEEEEQHLCNKHTVQHTQHTTQHSVQIPHSLFFPPPFTPLSSP